MTTRTGGVRSVRMWRINKMKLPENLVFAVGKESDDSVGDAAWLVDYSETQHMSFLKRFMKAHRSIQHSFRGLGVREGDRKRQHSDYDAYYKWRQERCA